MKEKDGYKKTGGFSQAAISIMAPIIGFAGVFSIPFHHENAEANSVQGNLVGQATTFFHPQDQIIVIPNTAKDGEEETTAKPTIQEELDIIIEKVKANKNLSYIFYRGLTQQNLIDDVTIYYPICKTVGDAYGLDWTLLFTILEEETAASRQIENGIYVGAMQIGPNYSDDYINGAFYGMGLGYLENSPGQRHPTDAKQIAGAARIITDHMKVPGGSILGALESYGPDAGVRLGMASTLKESLK